MKDMTEAFDNLKQSRESLFEASRELMSAENIDFGKAEAFFELAKRAEILRRDLKQLVDEESGTDENVGSSILHSMKKKPTRRKKRKDYPKYMMRNRSLVKIGLSRDEKSEYEHTVDSMNLVRILEKLNPFLSEEEFTIPEVLDGIEDIPDYQVYVVVANLRENGVFETLRKGVYKASSLAPGSLEVSDLLITKR